MTTLNQIFQSTEFVASALQALAGVFQGLATVGAVYLAYRYALRQMQKQARQQVQEDLRKRQADALQAAWALLQSLTTVDNGQNLLRYTQSKPQPGQQTERQYFVHLPSAQAFVFERLPNAFYASAAGLHWPPEVKDLFFEARGIVYGYLRSEKAAHSPVAPNAQDPSNPANPRTALHPVHKTELAERLQTIYQTLNTVLRKELQAVYA